MNDKLKKTADEIKNEIADDLDLLYDMMLRSTWRLRILNTILAKRLKGEDDYQILHYLNKMNLDLLDADYYFSGDMTPGFTDDDEDLFFPSIEHVIELGMQQFERNAGTFKEAVIEELKKL